MSGRLVALTRGVSRRIADCELSFVPREAIDLELAQAQHALYEAMLGVLGAEVIHLPEDDGFPDCVFVEDTVVVVDEVAVLTAPGADSRMGEVEVVGDALERFRKIERIATPARLDGGDVLRMGKTVYVGATERSRTGIDELSRLLSRYGYQVVPVAVHGCLHLKTGCTALDDETVLINTDWIDPAIFSDKRTLHPDAREPFGANTLRVGDTVLCAASAPRTTELIARDYLVAVTDIAELQKAEAGLTCMSVIFEV
jgi:dimethylargininase